jgi:hypothetical protein
VGVYVSTANGAAQNVITIGLAQDHAMVRLEASRPAYSVFVGLEQVIREAGDRVDVVLETSADSRINMSLSKFA